jgi:hypothetical protein
MAKRERPLFAIERGTLGGSRMLVSGNLGRYLVSYALAYIVFILLAKWYIWPSVKDRSPATALTPFLLYAPLRVNGLMFLMPGLVSSDLPPAFAVPTAYGDLTAALLSLAALACLRYELKAAVPMLWLFNIVGLLDLVYANISSIKDNVDPALLGASYYLAVINVPAMVVVHVMIFMYLLRWPKQARASRV